MNFNGTWEVYSQENLEDFLKAAGASEMIKFRKQIKPVFVIEQKGQDFTWTAKTPSSTHVNTFSLGKESEITSINGKKIKCSFREENGKLIVKGEKFTSVKEIQGDEMVETYTAGSVTFTCRSKRV